MPNEAGRIYIRRMIEANGDLTKIDRQVLSKTYYLKDVYRFSAEVRSEIAAQPDLEETVQQQHFATYQLPNEFHNHETHAISRTLTVDYASGVPSYQNVSYLTTYNEQTTEYVNQWPTVAGTTGFENQPPTSSSTSECVIVEFKMKSSDEGAKECIRLFVYNEGDLNKDDRSDGKLLSN
ncbi:hypothetical protein M3Y94_01157200 [Aphelenchoides besseyi]|nr:hypothetical protein M3Y94_01157200 [Aphelenchoides besseyi]